MKIDDFVTADVLYGEDLLAMVMDYKERTERTPENDTIYHDLLKLINEVDIRYMGEKEFIRDSHLTEYVQEYCDACEGTGKLPYFIVIDWESTVRDFKHDYFPVIIMGVQYWCNA